MNKSRLQSSNREKEMIEANAGSQDGATYKVAEAARIARVGAGAIRRGIKAGSIPHIRFGRNILIPKNAFHRWLDSCGGRAVGPTVA
jgi:excisionase family DNA binding protein